MSDPKEGSRDVYEGIIVSMVPDICMTPAGGGMVPVPYTIWCRQSDAANLANSVRQSDDRSHVIASLVVRCYGDEPGTGGGIFSGTTGAECTPKTWSQTVRAESRNMVRHLDDWWMNHRNTYGRLMYVKDMASYDTPDAQQVAPQMHGLPATNHTSAAATAQFSQLLQADATAVGGSLGGGGIDIPSPWDALKGAGRAIGVGGAATLGLATAFLLASTTSTAKDDVRVSGDCKLIPYKNNKCPPGSQAHHVVAGRSLAGQLAYGDGLTLCLKGNAFPRTLLTGHAVAQAGYDLGARATAAQNPDGMLSLGTAENLGAAAAAAGAKADGKNCNPAAFKLQLSAYHTEHGLSPETRVKP